MFPWLARPARKSPAHWIGQAYSFAPQLEGPGFVLSLQRHACQHVRRAEIGRLERDHHPTIGKRRSALREAHAIGAEVSRLGHAGNHLPPRAHAKAEQVDLAARHHAIVRGAEAILQPRWPILDPIHLFLRLFDAHAELKGLLLHRHATGVQHLVSVPRAVPNGQHQQ